MRNWTVKAAVVGTALVLGLAIPVMAQAQDKPLVGAGISFLHDEDATATGVAFDVAVPVHRMDKASLSVVGDVGFNHFEGLTASSFLGGVRFTGKANKVAPFAQFLIGAEHCCGSTDTAFQPGFGIDYAVSPMLNVRGQFDIRIVTFDGGHATEQRFWFGVSFPIGAK